MKSGKFPGGFAGFNMNTLMQQAQKMQRNMLQKKEELEEQEHTATAGGGAVTVTVKGRSTLSAIKISPDAVDKDDMEMLEDMIMAAVNEALKAAKDTETAELRSITGGVEMPL